MSLPTPPSPNLQILNLASAARVLYVLELLCCVQQRSITPLPRLPDQHFSISSQVTKLCHPVKWKKTQTRRPIMQKRPAPLGLGELFFYANASMPLEKSNNVVRFTLRMFVPPLRDHHNEARRSKAPHAHSSLQRRPTISLLRSGL